MRPYLLTVFLFYLGSFAAPTALISQTDHGIWNELLQEHVSASGKVNYNGFRSDKEQLQVYLDKLANNPVAADWTKNEKLAYWINAYNAFTIKLIIDNYPVKSITDLHQGKPWDVKWIKLGNNTYSLNQIENEIIRPQFQEPRIHFAVNCAARSCPPLLNRAFTPDQLDSQLTLQTKAFINNSNFNSLRTKSVEVSKIFEWYADDFGDLIAFLNKYSETRVQAKAQISYKEYNWALNE